VTKGEVEYVGLRVITSNVEDEAMLLSGAIFF
jgi:hypothetical protein